MTCKKHAEFEMPTEPHAKARYESAMKHVEFAKKNGASVEEIHAIFKRVMEFDPIKDFDKIPQDEAHKRYRMAISHVKKAMEAGKSAEEIHDLYKKVLNGTGEGKCAAKKEN